MGEWFSSLKLKNLGSFGVPVDGALRIRFIADLQPAFKA